MKINYSSNRGTVAFFIILLLIILIIAGTIIYILYRLSQLPPIDRDPDDDPENEIFLITEDPEVVQQYIPTLHLQGEVVSNAVYTATIERSTNLLDWEELYTVPSYEFTEINDTNPPWPNAFYRVRFDEQ